MFVCYSFFYYVANEKMAMFIEMIGVYGGKLLYKFTGM